MARRIQIHIGLCAAILLGVVSASAHDRCDAFKANRVIPEAEAQLLVDALMGLTRTHFWPYGREAQRDRQALAKIFPVDDNVIDDLTLFERHPLLSQSWNAATFDQLTMRSAELDRLNLSGLSFDRVDAIYDGVSENPVACLRSLPKYDPTGQKGLCFGRAMAAHLEGLIHHGVAPVNIMKLWAVADFRGTDTYGRPTGWHFHVATIFRGKDSRWYAIDPRLAGPVELRKWAAYWQEYDVKGDMALFVTSPTLAFPNSVYYSNKVTQSDPFFLDLINIYLGDARELLARSRTLR